MARRPKQPLPEIADTGVPRRLRSSVAGLDEALCGGLLEGRTYLLKGAPGTGKTILASHYCCDAARAGRNSLYVTLLAESHAELLQNLRTFSFFDEGAARKHMRFASGYSALMDGGLEGLAKVLRAEVRERNCRILVIDSINLAIERSSRSEAVKRFMRDLGTYCGMLGCTVLQIATSHGVAGKFYFIETIVDGIVELGVDSKDLRDVRTASVVKHRGSSHLEGKHYFEITSAGCVVHPRLEAKVSGAPRPAAKRAERVAFGIEALDAMLRGGVIEGSSTAVLGPPGAGKTVLGMQFLEEGARRDEPCLYFGFFEPPPIDLGKPKGGGPAMLHHARRKRLELFWRPPLEHSIDEIAEIILGAVRRSGARRVFVDGVDGFRLCSAFPERLPRFFGALTNELRSLGATSLFSQGIELFSSRISEGDEGISRFFENLLLLRYVEVRSHLHRLFSILKVRESDYDTAIREFRIKGGDIELADSCANAEALRAAQPRVSTKPPAVRRPRARRRS